MIKTFSLVVDLLQLPFSAEHLLLAEKLIDKPDVKLISFYSQGFVFLAFQEMLLGKISQEEFIALGDSFGTLYKYQTMPVFARAGLVYGLLHDPQKYANASILFCKEEKELLEKEIPSLKTILQSIKSQIFYL